jgi:hypothetical protein
VGVGALAPAAVGLDLLDGGGGEGMSLDGQALRFARGGEERSASVSAGDASSEARIEERSCCPDIKQAGAQ